MCQNFLVFCFLKKNETPLNLTLMSHGIIWEVRTPDSTLYISHCIYQPANQSTDLQAFLLISLFCTSLNNMWSQSRDFCFVFFWRGRGVWDELGMVHPPLPALCIQCNQVWFTQTTSAIKTVLPIPWLWGSGAGEQRDVEGQRRSWHAYAKSPSACDLAH